MLQHLEVRSGHRKSNHERLTVRGQVHVAPKDGKRPTICGVGVGGSVDVLSCSMNGTVYSEAGGIVYPVSEFN